MIAAADERAIVAVLLRYASAIDRRDWGAFRSCFTEDCRADYPGFGSWQGAEAITTFMREAHASIGATLHRMTNFEIAGDAETALARSYVDVLLTAAEPDGAIRQAAGWYEDGLRRTADGWRIAARAYCQVVFRIVS